MLRWIVARVDWPDRGAHLDIAVYLVFFVFATLTAVDSEFFGYRAWAACALPAYLFGLGQAIVRWRCPAGPGTGRLARFLWSRYTPIGLVAVLGVVVPLAVLLVTRLHRVDWSEQPEVWVVERSTVLLFSHGTPYTDLATLGHPPVVADYTPYGPAMTVFGLPRVLFGASVLTDARIAFALASAGAVALAWRLVGRPRLPVRAAQLAVASPLTALTWSVAGDDLPIAALVVLALALLYRRMPAWCGLVIGVAVSMKLTASSGLVVLAIAVLAIMGWRAFGRFVAAVIGVTAALNLPVLLVNPDSFVEHVVRFPIGLGRAHSPAASPLPGNLISRLGAGGHVVSLMLLFTAAIAMGVWLVRRPPATATAATLRIAAGLTAGIMLAPATRYGYLVYPLVLLGAAITLRQRDSAPTVGAVRPVELTPGA